MYIFLICLCILIVIFLLLLLFANTIYRVAFGKRQEGNPLLKYFTAEDFDGLSAEPIAFKSNKGQTLRGYLYKDASIKDYKALLIFAHGMGGGHLSYTTEINTFAKAGFLVLAYDNTGTMQSEGKNLIGMGQSVLDLKSAIEFSKTDARTKDFPCVLVGHSWGAYAVCRVLAFKPDVKGVLSFSAPESVWTLLSAQVRSQTKLNLSFLNPFYKAIEFAKFGTLGIQKTSDILKDTDIPVFLLHGFKDGIVPLSIAPAGLKSLNEKENIGSKVYPQKQHNVYASLDAENYIAEAFAKIGVLSGKGQNPDALKAYASTLDFQKMCEEDKSVIQTALNFLSATLDKN